MDKYNSPAEVDRQSKMSEELAHLHEVTGELLKHAEHLEVKLQGVLQPQPKATSSDTPREGLPGRIDEIRTCRDRVTSANYMLISIISRLEV